MEYKVLSNLKHDGTTYVPGEVVEMEKKKQADEYGKTHYVAVDTWKPEPKAEAVTTDSGDPDLPF